MSTRNPYRRLLPLRSGASSSRPGRFLDLGDQLPKGESWALSECTLERRLRHPIRAKVFGIGDRE
jgi:hypothetical protein